MPSIYTKSYVTGDNINYYQIEEKYEPYWEWAVIYNGSWGHLTRPSRELYKLICQEGAPSPAIWPKITQKTPAAKAGVFLLTNLFLEAIVQIDRHFAKIEGEALWNPFHWPPTGC